MSKRCIKITDELSQCILSISPPQAKHLSSVFHHNNIIIPTVTKNFRMYMYKDNQYA